MTKFGDEIDDSKQPRRLTRFYINESNEAPGVGDDDDRDEKPSQRVPSVYMLLVLGVYLLLGYLTQLVEDEMPSVVMEASLAKDNSDTFSEEAARRYLHKILGDSPRVSGTRYHLEKTRDMKSLVDDIAAQAAVKVVTDWQTVTGAYFLNRSAPFVNYYQNCSNIIALLEGESGYLSNGTLGSSILVNCHYDSVPFATGASDNGIFCAAMAEVLSKLSKRKTKLKHNVIFLFNGAEENPLQASHAFLSHPWAKGAAAVINLDSAGMNGKAMVFQVTDPRVLEAYARTAVRPAAQGLGEYLFSTGMIQSDTDFRIFRDFGDIYGVDIAFTKMGHVYHTRNDVTELIKPGVIQCAGNMLLSLVAALADEEDMAQKVSPTAAVFFDYLNWFMFTYSFAVAYGVDVLIIVFGLASVYYYLWLVGVRSSSVKELLLSALGRMAAMVAGVALGALCVLVMVKTTTQMRYLSRTWLAVPLYWLPYLTAAVAASHTYDTWRTRRSYTGLSRSLRAAQAQAATRLLLAGVALALVCMPNLKAVRYLFSVSLFIMAAVSFVSLTLLRYVRLTGWQHLVLEIVLSLPTVMWTMSLALRLDAMMLPMMGRSSLNSPDYTVGLLNIGLVAFVATAVSGIELLFSRRHMWLVLASVGAVCAVLMFIPFSPYDAKGVALQRHYWFHSQITSHDLYGQPVEQTSGILVMRQDPYTTEDVARTLAASGIHLAIRHDVGEQCQTQVYCGMPTYRTAFGTQYQDTIFLSTGPPAPFTPPASLAVESKVCSGNTCTYSFLMTGQAHNIVTLWPVANVSLASWSLPVPCEASFTQLGRPVYSIYHSTSTYMERWHLQFEAVFNVPPALQSGPVVEVSHHSNKIYSPEDFTTEYKRILSAMPDFFNIATILSVRNNYVY